MTLVYLFLGTVSVIFALAGMFLFGEHVGYDRFRKDLLRKTLDQHKEVSKRPMAMGNGNWSYRIPIESITD